jgi:hypothetical protein
MDSRRIAHIVFTKNRPLQLHGYLESLRRFFPAEAMQTYILYKPDLFGAEYEICFAAFPDCRVIRETNFHQDFISLFGSLKTEYVLFGVDDVAYFDGVSLDTVKNTFARLGEQLFGFSLRLDKRQMPQDIAAGNLQDLEIDGKTVHTVNWRYARNSSAGYPFELCATIYHIRDIRRVLDGTVSKNGLARHFLRPGSAFVNGWSRIFKVRKLYKKFGFFYNPNTLESWCCRYVQKHPEKFGPLLAFQNICASAIQVNMVNTATTNQWDDSAELTVEKLAEKYRQGWRLDIDWLCQNRPQSTHADAPFFRLKENVSGIAKTL